MKYLILTILLFPVFIIMYADIRRYLHMIQLEGYKNLNFIKWAADNLREILQRAVPVLVLLLVLYAFIFRGILDQAQLFYILIPLWIVVCIITYLFVPNKKEKKKLVFTARAKRLLIANSFIVIFLLYLMYRIAGIETIVSIRTVYFLLGAFCLKLLAFIIMITANGAMLPLEKCINRYYFIKARNKLRRLKGLTVVGITGSFGKTSTKHFLKTILEEKYKVYMTPESYNTPMGIAKVVNKELNEDTEIFVAEMGAYKPGEIQELVQLTGPKIGILTSIGKQHLNTFKTIDNVAKTKYELINGLPDDGLGIFNGDNEYCSEYYNRTKIKKLRYSISKQEDMDLYIDNMELSSQGMSFILNTEHGQIRCTAKILGLHNASNIAAASLAALNMGLTLEEIACGISRIEPVPHRLQLINSGSGVTVIDDAFNSNPVGSKMALETLKLFSGRKIIITPGMVDLGEEEYKLNREFGEKIAEVCDYAILIGKNRAKPIIEGLKAGKYDDNRILVADSLDEAVNEKLKSISQAGDVVLFENDLTDNLGL